MMKNPLLERPAPDFAELERVLKGKQEPRRVHIVELLIDEEVLQAITARYLGKPWISWGKAQGRTEDTAELSRGERGWVAESRGLISSWEEFEGFPWEKIQPDFSPCEFVARNLPEGMKVTVTASLFEHVLENLLGYEGLFFMLHDDRELVAQVFARWGQKVYDYYASVIGMEQVGAIFHADDLGFKTSTLLSPDDLRRLVFPWLKKYAALAHEHGKMFWYHCCGNVYRNGVI
ncbi:MAG: hypothetical protein FJ014_19135, partial [Chloroflexi bacterium]|nr:hypothetical protein [Chloroflexota bacterium]